MPDKRGPKTSTTQFKIYLDYLSKYKVLRTGKLEPCMDPKYIQTIYEKMVIELNACGQGPTKNVDAWKKSLSEWKCNVKKRARERKDLKEIENMLLNLLGIGLITGLTAINEVGIREEASEPTDHEDPKDETEVLSDEVIEPESLNLPSSSNIETGIIEAEPKADSSEADGTSTSLPDQTSKKNKRFRQKARGKNASKSSELINDFKIKEHENNMDLFAIAASLKDVAGAINRIADVLEVKL